MSKELDVDVRAFIRHFVSSLPALDVFVLLAREPARTWRVIDITHALGTENASVKQAVLDLVSTEVVSHIDGTNRFKLARHVTKHPSLLSAIVRAYETERAAIVEVFVARSLERLRVLVEAYRSDSPNMRRATPKH